MKREEFFEKAKAGVRKAFLEKDRLLIQTVGAIGELDKSANLLYERLREWHEFYFPELRLSENEKYALVVKALDRDNPDEVALARIVGEAKAKEIVSKCKTSFGADFEKEDLEAVKALAERVSSLYKLRRELEEYQRKLAAKVCPNIAHLVEAPLASKLIAQAGSLEKLAQMPAGTIQVLGAEKALFKHLRKHTKPPKHGVLFQHPAVNTAPQKLRGKIARALATKIAIAAKADAYTKHFIAESLKADFEKRLSEIRGKQ